jgi:hypothetical protein
MADLAAQMDMVSQILRVVTLRWSSYLCTCSSSSPLYVNMTAWVQVWMCEAFTFSHIAASETSYWCFTLLKLNVYATFQLFSVNFNYTACVNHAITSLNVLCKLFVQSSGLSVKLLRRLFYWNLTFPVSRTWITGSPWSLC